jgi:hypothetical protein
MALLRNQLAALSGKGPGDGDTIARPVLHPIRARWRAASATTGRTARPPARHRGAALAY